MEAWLAMEATARRRKVGMEVGLNEKKKGGRVRIRKKKGVESKYGMIQI